MKQPVPEDMPTTEGPRGLRLPQGNLGVGETEQRAIQANWNTIGKIEGEIAQQGLASSGPPPFVYPGTVTPAQLTTQDNQAYSTLYAEHLGWYNFAAVTLARIRAVLLQLNNEMDDIAVHIRKDMKDQNRRSPKNEQFTEKDITDSVALDPHHRTLSLTKQEYEQKKLEYDAYLDSMDRNLKVISRQVEIRRLEHEGGKIEGAMPYRGRDRQVRAPGQ